MTEPTRCITCKHFTLRPRKANGSNETQRELDRMYITLGMGRCAYAELPTATWHSAECPRECARVAPIAADQVQARRQFMAQRRA
jgi:hypothetical protein